MLGSYISIHKRSFRGPGSVSRGLVSVCWAKICARGLASVASRCIQGASRGLPWPPVAFRLTTGRTRYIVPAFQIRHWDQDLMSQCVDLKNTFLDTQREFRQAIGISSKFPIVCEGLQPRETNFRTKNGWYHGRYSSNIFLSWDDERRRTTTTDDRQRNDGPRNDGGE